MKKLLIIAMLGARTLLGAVDPIATAIIASTTNSTTAPLGIGETFTGVAESLTNYGELDINLAGSAASVAPGTLFFEYSPDGTNWDVSVPITVADINTGIVPIPLRNVLKFFRVRYVNGAVAQTAMRLTVTLHAVTARPLTRFLNQSVGVGEPSTAATSFMYVLNPATGTYNSVTGTVMGTTNALDVAAIPVDGRKNTYRASFISGPMAALTTDFFTLTGSATRVVKVLFAQCNFSGGGLTYLVQMVKRSTANTLGTSTVVTAVPNDSTDPAATAVARLYTTNPTVLGTAAGTVGAVKVSSSLASSAATGAPAVFDFGARGGRAMTLRGTSQVLSFNGNGATGATNASCVMEWVEE